MKRDFNELFYFFFPKRCAVCGRVIRATETFCKNCVGVLTPINVKTCLRCGLPKDNCECKRYAYHFRGISAPFMNSGRAQEAVYLFKFKKNIDAAEYFAKEIVSKICRDFPDVIFDCVTSVPPHWWKNICHWYDHAAILGRAVAGVMCLPYKKLLIKCKWNKTQHRLKAKERFRNVKNAYRAKENNYRAVLLIDDIKTTGATLDECARQLMLSGCSDVYVATVVIGACKNKES